jgi:hypothetical protein
VDAETKRKLKERKMEGLKNKLNFGTIKRNLGFEMRRSAEVKNNNITGFAEARNVYLEKMARMVPGTVSVQDEKR